MQSEQHFSRIQDKGTLPPEKRALFVSSENLGALAPLPPPPVPTPPAPAGKP